MPQPGHEAIDALAEPLSPAPGLASRGDRLLAVIVDSFVELAVAIPFGIYDGHFSAALQGRPVPPAVYAQTFIVGWAWFFLVNGYLLKKYGQTVGKRFLDIRICDFRTAAVPPLWRLLVRILVPGLAGLLGALGGLLSWVDILFIFRKDRRCVHDWIASTRVVRS